MSLWAISHEAEIWSHGKLPASSRAKRFSSVFWRCLDGLGHDKKFSKGSPDFSACIGRPGEKWPPLKKIVRTCEGIIEQVVSNHPDALKRKPSASSQDTRWAGDDSAAAPGAALVVVAEYVAS